MNTRAKLSRREFLRLSAMAAGSAALAACGPKVTSTAAPTAVPTAPPVATAVPAATIATAVSKYKEAPMLAKLVAEGQLPPVDQRLPKNPLVVNHGWLTPGKYGGIMQWATSYEWGLTHFPIESAYGNSPLRWLKDGLEIGAGTADSWEMNADATEFTLHFREGLRWSDGEPVTTEDVMYWWEDMVLNPDHPEVAPDSLKSGTGTVAELTAVDAQTIRMKFDVPSPLTFAKIASWVKWLFGSDYWTAPKHYLKQFHPKYNAQYTDFAAHDEKSFSGGNPDLPTMTGWRLMAYEQGQRVVWERNPYYYCVDAQGNQLPYMDGFVNTNYQNGETEKLSILEGKVDFSQWSPFSLADIPTLRDEYSRSKVDVRLWNQGTGTGASCWLSLDYKEEAYRNLFAQPQFRKALSHALNREEARKVIYLGNGELTTGTDGSSIIEFNVNDEAKSYFKQWRDSAVTYDTDLANSLLDELGLKDVDGDGFREFPDGQELEITIDFDGSAAPGGEYVIRNEMIARDWSAVGIKARANPVAPDSFVVNFSSGQGMSYANTSVDDAISILLYPVMMVPVNNFLGWAPLQGQWNALRGTDQENVDQDKDPWERNPPWREPEPGGVVEQLQMLLDQAKVEPEAMKRHQLVWKMIKLHIEQGPFFYGVVYNLPSITLVKDGLLNVPTREDLDRYAAGGLTGPWQCPSPATYDPESWYFDVPEDHV